jgi:hypothetical protein
MHGIRSTKTLRTFSRTCLKTFAENTLETRTPDTVRGVMSAIAPSTSNAHRLDSLRASLSAEATQNPVNLELGHRKHRQLVVIGGRPFDSEDARLHKLIASLSAEATQNPVNSKCSTPNQSSTHLVSSPGRSGIPSFLTQPATH